MLVQWICFKSKYSSQ